MEKKEDGAFKSNPGALILNYLSLPFIQATGNVFSEGWARCSRFGWRVQTPGIWMTPSQFWGLWVPG